MTVTIESETEVPFDFEYEQTAREVIAQAMDSEEFPYEAEVNLLLVDNDIIHELNLEHRGIDRATDVLFSDVRLSGSRGFFSYRRGTGMELQS